MEYLATTAADQKDSSVDQVNRPLEHFHPNVWGDFFLNYTPPPKDTQLQMEQEVNELKEEVRKNLLTTTDNPKKKLIYVDAVEQLGVAYYFEDEIEAILQQFHNKYAEGDAEYENDLHYVSLRFRILRQHGFFVSCDIFEKFKNKDENFKEFIATNVEGLLNLYEASYLKVHGEKILDEAMQFTTTKLKSLLGKLDEPLATQVSRALRMPLHKCFPRLVSRYYLETYENNCTHDKSLLRFAKLDFTLLRLLHVKELQDLSRWWEKIDIAKNLPFTRDRLVEGYVWALGNSYEPQCTLSRAIYTKLAMNTSIMDDTYDAYGLFKELEVYTKAVQRWDKICMKELPDYMKFTYETLLDTFDEVEQDVAEKGRSHLVDYVRELMKAHCRCYLQEAKWLHDKYLPTYDEYMERAAIITGGNILLSGAAFLGMEEFAKEEFFQWVSQMPKPVKAASVICRLLNDISSLKRERNRNYFLSSVDCLMAQYGISEEEAIKEIYKRVDDAWMDLNEEMLRPTKAPKPLITLYLNMTRTVEFFYELGEDEYSIVNQNMRDKIKALLIDPIIL